MMLIFLLAIFVLVVGSCLLVREKWRMVGRIILTVWILAVGVFLGIVGALVAAFSTPRANFYAPATLFFVAFFVAAFLLTLWGAIKKKKVYIPLLAILLLLVGATAGEQIHYAYQESIPTLGETKTTYDFQIEYAPYDGEDKVAKLEEESTLLLTEDLPVLDGATALYPVYSAFARAVYPEAAIDNVVKTETGYTLSPNDYLKCTTTSGAYRNIVTGEADIIFVAGPDEEQVKFAEENGVELVYTPIGKEAFVFFVNSKNPLRDITVEEVQGIYSGKITEWDTLGVEGLGKIRAFQRDAGSGSQSALLRLMGDIPLMEPPTEDVLADMGGIITKAADYKNYKNAIGYSFRFYSTEMVQNDQIKLLSINGIAPTLENIENGTYPIASHFYAVTRKDSGENMEKLLEWILSPQGQKLIERTGYTPIK